LATMGVAGHPHFGQGGGPATPLTGLAGLGWPNYPLGPKPFNFFFFFFNCGVAEQTGQATPLFFLVFF
jgi:hypothetical protein